MGDRVQLQRLIKDNEKKIKYWKIRRDGHLKRESSMIDLYSMANIKKEINYYTIKSNSAYRSYIFNKKSHHRRKAKHFKKLWETNKRYVDYWKSRQKKGHLKTESSMIDLYSMANIKKKLITIRSNPIALIKNTNLIRKYTKK